MSLTESCARLLAGNLLCYSCSIKVVTTVHQLDWKRMRWQMEASCFRGYGKGHVQLDSFWDSRSMSNHFRTRAAFFILDSQWPRPIRPSSLEDREILSRSVYGSWSQEWGRNSQRLSWSDKVKEDDRLFQWFPLLSRMVHLSGDNTLVKGKARLQPDEIKITPIMPPSMR